MSKARHTLENLSQIAKWIESNESQNKYADNWRDLSQSFAKIEEAGCFLDISKIKENASGSVKVESKTGDHHQHPTMSFVISTNKANFEVFDRYEASFVKFESTRL